MSLKDSFQDIFDYYHLPSLELQTTFKDRCLWKATPEFLSAIRKHPKFRSVNAFKNHGVRAVASWREDVRWWSMQIVQQGEFPEDVLIETDIDRWNPDFGVWPTLVHGVREVLWHRLGGSKPNPDQVAEGLQKRGIVPAILLREGRYHPIK